MTFDSVPQSLQHALAERGYREPTPVQAAVIGADAVGRDLLVSAQTGSGKTVAYGLALADTLMPGGAALPAAGRPLALVVAPTRELALQVGRELEWLYAPAGAAVVECVGGMDPGRERRRLAAGAHIVVGTPGRLRDHIERRALDVASLSVVVLDEADEMLDLGFREDLEVILDATPTERRTLLFSATLPKGIVALARRYQANALRIETAGDAAGHADIAYRAVRVAANERVHAIVNVLRHAASPGTIVFCNTRESVRHLHGLFQERGFAVVHLSGELSQNERNHALQALRDRRASICVATDVAARGLDLPNLDLVVHADLPSDPAVLQHRSGRTGRAGRKGVSVLIVPPAAQRKAERLLREAGVVAQWGAAPSAEAIRAADRERLLVDPLLTEAASEEDLVAATALLERFPAAHLAAALVRAYRGRQPEPEDVSDPGPASASPAPRRVERRDGGASSAGEGVWFRLNVGRKRNADPKWLLPMLCRRGRITRRDIGAIRIFDRETAIEIAADVAEAFAQHCAGPDADNVRIERAAAPHDSAVARKVAPRRPRAEAR